MHTETNSILKELGIGNIEIKQHQIDTQFEKYLANENWNALLDYLSNYKLDLKDSLILEITTQLYENKKITHTDPFSALLIILKTLTTNLAEESNAKLLKAVISQCILSDKAITTQQIQAFISNPIAVPPRFQTSLTNDEKLSLMWQRRQLVSDANIASSSDLKYTFVNHFKENGYTDDTY